MVLVLALRLLLALCLFVSFAVLPILAVLVVFFSLFRIAQYFIGFIDFFEFLFRSLIIWIDIGMVFSCQFTVRFLDFCSGGRFTYAQYFVIIDKCHMLYLLFKRF